MKFLRVLIQIILALRRRVRESNSVCFDVHNPVVEIFEEGFYTLPTSNF